MSLAATFEANLILVSRLRRASLIITVCRMGKRGKESVILGSDIAKLAEKCQRKFTKLMSDKYGIGLGNFVTKPKVKLECGPGLRRDIEPKKLQILSSLLFSSINDILQSGEVIEDNELLDNLQISKIDLSKNLQDLKIFWVASGTEEDLKVQNVLDECIPAFRRALLRLNFVGFVPKIQFVRDLSEANLAEFTRLLEKADTGEPFRLSPLKEAILFKNEMAENSEIRDHFIKKAKSQHSNSDVNQPPSLENTDSS